MTESRSLSAPTPRIARSGQLASLDTLAAIPEGDIWLASPKSARTRRAYRPDVAHLMRTLGITSPDQLRQVDYRAVITWERVLRDQEDAAASTTRRRLAALSSLFKHLVRHGAGTRHPLVDVERPSINRDEDSTAAFSKVQARRLRDASPADAVAGVRDRAILSVGCRWGFAALRSPRLRSKTCTRIAVLIPCVSSAKADAVMHWPSIPIPRSASVHTSMRQDMPTTWTGRCSGP